MRYFYRLDGTYAAFEVGGYLFTPDADWIGSIDEDGSVWREDGSYMGEVWSDRYIVRNPAMMEPMQRMGRMTPMTPMTPMRPMNLMGVMQPMGYDDALEGFGDKPDTR